MYQQRTPTLSARSLTRMALCVAVISVSAYIAVPVPFAAVVVTMVTLTMNLAAFVLTPAETFLVLAAYVLLGAAGLPVFANGAAGVGQLFGPSGGFLIGFIVTYPIVSYLKGADNSFRRYWLVGACVGIPLSYIGGVISVMLVLDLTLPETLAVAALPYIPFDIAKAGAAAFIAVRLNQALARV